MKRSLISPKDVAKSTFNTDLDCALIVIHEDIEEKVTANNTENKIEGLAANITGAAAMVCFDTVNILKDFPLDNVQKMTQYESDFIVINMGDFYELCN